MLCNIHWINILKKYLTYSHEKVATIKHCLASSEMGPRLYSNQHVYIVKGVLMLPCIERLGKRKLTGH